MYRKACGVAFHRLPAPANEDKSNCKIQKSKCEIVPATRLTYRCTALIFELCMLTGRREFLDLRAHVIFLVILAHAAHAFADDTIIGDELDRPQKLDHLET